MCSLLGTAGKSLINWREIKQQLIQRDATNALWQRDLSLSWNKVGEVRFAQNDFAEALDAYQKGLEIRESLVKRDLNSTAGQADLAYSELGVGKALAALNRKAEASTKMESARQRLISLQGRVQLTVEQKGVLSGVEAALKNLEQTQ